jgi:hypothetical protein
MQKIISLYQRNYDTDRLVREEVVPGAEWVLAGEGTATRKWDGTCCLVRNGNLYKRYEVKRGNKPPKNFEPACDVDPRTGKQQGWLPVGNGPEDQWHREAFPSSVVLFDGTYELVGPKVQGNPERQSCHVLIPHGAHEVDAPRSFVALREWLRTADIEGVVWHHPDGRMVKIKARDFGWKR